MKQRIVALLIVLVSVLGCFPISAFANAAEPPALIVILKDAPQDAAISIVSAGAAKAGLKSEVAWETYYVFYNRDMGSSNEIILKVSGNGMEYEQIIGKQHLNAYTSVITLDLAAQTIEAGKLLTRSILLVTLRLFLTLAIEGIIFFLFGFRNKKSWRVFLIMNLVTQGILNIVLDGATPLAYYLIFNLIFMEAVIFLAEIFGVLVLIKEHGEFRRVSFALVANTASLILGGYWIMNLPV